MHHVILPNQAVPWDGWSPTFGQKEPRESGTRQLAAKAENWEAVYAGMRDVVHSKRGTAKALAKGIEYQMAGKTGTAQVIGIAQNAVYKEDEVDERHRHHGLFIAFAPIEAPTIAVAIIVENGGGSSAASPIARHVIDTWLFGKSSFGESI